MKKHARKEDFYSFYESQTKEQGTHASFQRRKKQSPWVRVALTLFVGLIAASAWFGYLYFSGRTGVSDDLLDITVDAPHEAANGSVVEYRLTYKNRGRSVVPAVALFVEYAIGFTFVESAPVPENTKNNYWNIGDVAAGARGEIVIRGTLAGLEGEERKAQFSFQYTHPLYRSSFFIKREAATAMQPARADALRFTGPQTINAGDTGSFEIRYQDVSKLGTPDSIILALVLPDGVMVEKAEPAFSDLEKKEWGGFALSKSINPVAQGGSLSLTLKVDEALQGDVPLTVRLLLRNGATGVDSILRETTYTLNVLRSALSFVVHTAAADTLVAARFGEAQQYVLEYTNKGNIIFNNITIRLSSESSAIEWKTSAFKGATIDRQTVTWNSQTFTELQELRSGETKRIPFTLGIKNLDEIGDTAVELTNGIPLAIDAAIGEQQEKSIDGPRLTLPLLSDVRLRAFVRDVSSEGGQKTFRVYLAVTHSIHDIDDIEVSVVLPSAVAWSGVNSRTAGDITYNSATTSVVWKLNTLPVSVKRIDGSFDITVPASGVAADVKLVERLTLTARDRQVNSPLRQTIETLTGLQTDDVL